MDAVFTHFAGDAKKEVNSWIHRMIEEGKDLETLRGKIQEQLDKSSSSFKKRTVFREFFLGIDTLPKVLQDIGEYWDHLSNGDTEQEAITSAAKNTIAYFEGKQTLSEAEKNELIGFFKELISLYEEIVNNRAPNYDRSSTARIIKNQTKMRQMMERVEQLGQEDRLIAITDRTTEYKEKWIEPLFLNNPSIDRDVKPVCPKDIYVTHHYLYNDETKPNGETKQPLMEELKKCGGHLVLGDPGIGKSTLISWYLNDSNDSRTMRVYRLTDFELSGEEKQPGAYLLVKMGLELEQLRDTVLFLDGLDECGINPEYRVKFLQELSSEWRALEKRNVSWVVTCRMNYISEEQLHRLRIPRITLLPMGPEQDGQIEQFIEKFEKALGNSISEKKRAALLSKNKKGEHGTPFGIPLILYMTIASDITVTEKSTMVDIYDQLFPALYERSSSYDEHEQEIVFRLREEIHQMSRDIAQWMLLNKSGTASIPESVYEEIENSYGDCVAGEQAHRIGSFFRALHHTEGETELCFIHRTMYEYFVADGFVHQAINAKTKEELSRAIAWYWYAGQMEATMQQYIREKLRKHKDALDFNLWEDAGLTILETGVYRCWQGISDRLVGCNCYNVPRCLLPHPADNLRDDRSIENTTFWNLCHLLAFIRAVKNIKTKIFKRKGFAKVLSRAIRHCSADFSPVYCCGFSLSYTGLSRTVLSHAILTDADLSHASLAFADLTGVDLTSTNLSETNMDDAVLTGALLSESQVRALKYEKLSKCRFERIRIASSPKDWKEYYRRDFFKHYFIK